MKRLKKLIKAIKKDYELYFTFDMRQYSKEHFLVIFYLWYTLRDFYKYLQIQICNHDFVDEGYATRESGCIEIVCSKCGYSANTVILY